MTGRRRRHVRLTATAQSDFRNILRWTAERFGHAQAHIHGETLTHTIQALANGPNVAGSRQRDDIAEGLMTLHVARPGPAAGNQEERGRRLSPRPFPGTLSVTEPPVL